MRRSWTDAEVHAAVRAAARGGVMPTASQMLERTGSHALSVQVSRRGGVDAVADQLGLIRATHDSRRGWRWEKWAAAMLRTMGANVSRETFPRSPHDLVVNGVDVDVKVANGAEWSGSMQWTWQISTDYRCSAYLLIGLEAGRPGFILVAPESEVPKTSATARRSSRDGRLGRWEEWRDAFHLLAA